MGYTHYWRGTAPVLTDELKGQIEEVFYHCSQNGIPLADGFGEGDPELNETRIWFNGSAAVGDDYETFGVEFGGEVSFNFCKTAELPYDIAVVAILAILTHHGQGRFSWTSDGDGTDRLDDGLALAAEILAV